jgi:prepilin-type processing-associated H-X9-DG protein
MDGVMNHRPRRCRRRRRCRCRRGAFSLVEVLVVIGIIAVLIGLLMPVLSSARRQAKCVQCKAQLADLGHALQMYSNDNQGWLYPCAADSDGSTIPHWGSRVPPHERWPMKVFKVAGAPWPPPYDPTQYDGEPDPIKFPAAPYTPAVLRCPSDENPSEVHSYVLNSHLCEHGIKAGGHDFGGLSASEVILAGEKRSTETDYYMQQGDFDRVVEQYRHGLAVGSNCLYVDGHVSTVLPKDARIGIDPWLLRATDPIAPP